MNFMPGNILLVISDCIIDKDIIECLANKLNTTKIVFFEKKLGQYTGLRFCYRHLMYFWLALRGYIYYSKHTPEFVLIWQQYIGLYFSLFSLLDITRIFRKNRSEIVLFYIIPKRKVVSHIFGRILDKGVVNKLVYFSLIDFNEARSEKKILLNYFQKPLSIKSLGEITAKPIIPGEYVFSGGTSNRDYSQIEKLAVAFPYKKFVVACTSKDVNTIKYLKNIEKFTDKYDNNFLNLIYYSSFVIIPLKNPNLSSGQIVLLRSLEFSKPVVTNFSKEALSEWLGKNYDRGVATYSDFDQLKQKVCELFDAKTLKAKSMAAHEVFAQNSYDAWRDKIVNVFLD